MAEPVKLAVAIREALDKFGNEAGKDITTKIKDWIKQHHPHLKEKVDSKNFGAAIGGERAKRRDADEVDDETKQEVLDDADRLDAQPDDDAEFKKVDEQQKRLTGTDQVGEIISAVETLKGLVARLGKDQVRRLLEVI